MTQMKSSWIFNTMGRLKFLACKVFFVDPENFLLNTPWRKKGFLHILHISFSLKNSCPPTDLCLFVALYLWVWKLAETSCFSGRWFCYGHLASWTIFIHVEKNFFRGNFLRGPFQEISCDENLKCLNFQFFLFLCFLKRGKTFW